METCKVSNFEIKIRIENPIQLFHGCDPKLRCMGWMMSHLLSLAFFPRRFKSFHFYFYFTNYRVTSFPISDTNGWLELPTIEVRRWWLVDYSKLLIFILIFYPSFPYWKKGCFGSLQIPLPISLSIMNLCPFTPIVKNYIYGLMEIESMLMD